MDSGLYDLGMYAQISVTVGAALVMVVVWLVLGLLGARASRGRARTWFIVTAVIGGLSAVLLPVLSVAGTAVLHRLVPVEGVVLVSAAVHGASFVIGLVPYALLALALVFMGPASPEA